ncbi:hypothetical protein KR009_004730 [Drosophila setifemur]|nr:hypothetical protein KR009_004730 [Drosophila setifemur]
MAKTAFLAALMLLGSLMVLCQDSQSDYEIFMKGVKSLNNVVFKYQSEFDKKVKFIELQGAVDAIDKAMLGYQGKAQSRLDEMRTLNSEARLQYHKCVGPVFEWCLALNSTLNIFIPHIKSPTLSKESKDVMWSIMVTALNSGLAKTTKSLDLLDLVQNRTAELKNLFDSMLHEVHDDFSPNGFYGKEKLELERNIQRRNDLRLQAFIGGFFAAIGSLIFGTIGLAIGLTVVAIGLGIEEIEYWNRITRYEDQIRAIDATLRVIESKIKEATEIVKDVNLNLEVERTNLYTLRGKIEGANNNLPLLNNTLHGLLVPNLSDLGAQCYNYTMWHGFGSPFYLNKETDRAKRHATDICEAQRVQARTILAESKPSNSTLKTMEPILDGMSCGAKTWFPDEIDDGQPPVKDDIKEVHSFRRSSSSSPSMSMVVSYLKHAQ